MKCQCISCRMLDYKVWEYQETERLLNRYLLKHLLELGVFQSIKG
jgi:hypothetical protein